MIRRRKEYEIIVYGDYDLLLPDDRERYVYTRTLGPEKLLVIVNVYGNERILDLPDDWKMTEKKILIGNYDNKETEKLSKMPEDTLTIRPYETIVFLGK